MIDVLIRYTEPVCQSWRYQNAPCEHISDYGDIFNECDGYEAEDNRIGSSCKHLWFKVCFYQGTLKRFDFEEGKDIIIGRRYIPWGSIEYMTIKDGRKTIYKTQTYEVEE